MTGVDVSGESVAEASEANRDARCRYVHYRGDRLPFDDHSFDVAFSACVFHHIDRAQHAGCLQEIRRVLRPGGVFFLFEHNPLNPLTVRAVKACPFDEGVELLTPSYARRAVREAGLQGDAVRFYFFFPRALSALRAAERHLGWLPLGAQYYVAARTPAP